MLAEQYPRQIRGITGNGTSSVIIKPTTGKRLHNVQCEITFGATTATNVDTLAEQLAAITIRVKTGTKVRWELTGTQLRDFCLLRGTTFDFNAVSTYVAEITIPLAPEWFLAVVADMLAWNPVKLGGDITIEIDGTSSIAGLTLDVTAIETVSDDLNATSAGIMTLELIKPVGGSTSFNVRSGSELEMRGRLISASAYASGGTVTTAGVYLGKDKLPAFEDLSSAQNLEQLERKGLTPAASGRTASMFDIVPVKDDMLQRAWDLKTWGEGFFKLQASGGFTGVVPMILCRLESE